MTDRATPDPLRVEAEQLLHDLSRTLYGDQQQFEELALIEAFARRQRPEWQPIATLPGDYRGQFFTWWPDGHGDMMAGMDEYREILGYGEPPATHWMPFQGPPATSGSGDEAPSR